MPEKIQKRQKWKEKKSLNKLPAYKRIVVLKFPCRIRHALF